MISVVVRPCKEKHKFIVSLAGGISIIDCIDRFGRAFVYENIINLGDIISFSELPEGKAGRRMIKAAGSGFLFKYKKNLAGGKCWLLVAKGEEKNIRIVLEINDDGVSLSDYLSAVARFNCENK